MTFSTFTPQERMESVKGGVIAAAATLVAGILWHAGLIGVGLSELTAAVILDVAITTFCGFLFGVTYRYVMRQDTRSHLKSGAVGAFALVRGLSQLEGGVTVSWTGLTLVPLDLLPLFESFGVFAIAQLILDQALQRRLVRPMGGLSAVDDK